MPLATRDRIRITRNGTTADGKNKLLNGSMYAVAGFNRRGDIRLDNGQVVAKDFGHLAHGYCATSHASQGKTVDRVLVAVGPESFGAASREQFYVSVSRGRESVAIYCQDKRELFDAVSRSGTRLTATELTSQPQRPANTPPSRVVRHGEHIRRQQRAERVRRDAGARDRSTRRDMVPDRDKNRGLER